MSVPSRKILLTTNPLYTLKLRPIPPVSALAQNHTSVMQPVLNYTGAGNPELNFSLLLLHNLFFKPVFRPIWLFHPSCYMVENRNNFDSIECIATEATRRKGSSKRSNYENEEPRRQLLALSLFLSPRFHKDWHKHHLF